MRRLDAVYRQILMIIFTVIMKCFRFSLSIEHSAWGLHFMIVYIVTSGSSRRELYVMATNTTCTQDAQRKMLYNNRSKPAGHCNMNSFTIQWISVYIETSQILFILYQMELTKPNQTKSNRHIATAKVQWERGREREKKRESQASCTRDSLHSFPVLIEDRDSMAVEREGICQQPNRNSNAMCL